MNKMNTLALVAALGATSWLAGPAQAAGLLLEAEATSANSGGSLKPASDRPGSSGGKAVIGWDDKDQWLEWQAEVPVAGDYQLMLRYAAGRKWVVWRELKINGAVPAGFARIELANTGGWGRSANEWRNFVVAGADGQPLTLKLDKGPVTLRLTNLGGDGENGSANLDAVVLVTAGTPPESLLKP